jgi:apolipoprotein N-acyltransferase
MHEAVALEAPHRRFSTAARASTSALAEVSLVSGSALLTVLSFPNFDLWFLAWIGLVPLLVVLTRPLTARQTFLLGWWWGMVFFYGTCWWLTYSMTHYGHIPFWLAYPLLLLPVALVAFFPALFCVMLGRLINRFGLSALFAAPLIWVSTELARYAVTGLLWNALGYSQAFHPWLIQSAGFGGVYAISFLVMMANAAVAFALLRRTSSARGISLAVLVLIALPLAISYTQPGEPVTSTASSTFIVAVQPNVPMEGVDYPTTMQQLLDRHLELSRQGLARAPNDANPVRMVIWPESPMNFSYSRDSQLREIIADFARTNRTKVMLNSLEPAPNGGEQNSAVLINQEGRIEAQYDKIRLMPFGEYVPLPRWLPGASSVRGIVGDFTPGSSYTLMPLGALRAGVFICIESAHPSIARAFTNEYADVLINISNDGYLGPTPVMRQHLANAIFRAVENQRPLLRVTNTGITASIAPDGKVSDATPGFQAAVRTWFSGGRRETMTFYTRHGDVFVYACALITLGLVSATFMTRRKRT